MALKVNLGTLAGGTEVPNKIEAAKLHDQITTEPVFFATFVWFKASGSVERLSGYPSGVAA